MVPIRVVMLVLLVLGFVLRFVPRWGTDVIFATVVFVILLLILLGRLDG